jgi:putative endonuclease
MGVRRGQHWEAVAGEYLERQGLTILARGYRCRLGEIDLLCRDDSTLIVVEVRARSSAAHTPAVFSIGPQKRMRIIQATRHLLMRNAQWRTVPIRFDVIAFDAIDTDSPRVDWIKSAFEAC